MPNVKPKEDGNYALGFSGKYTLPICDTQAERRNFPGYVEYENMLPLDDTSGTTDTDVKTHGKGGDGYTDIYGGPKGSRAYTGQSPKRK